MMDALKLANYGTSSGDYKNMVSILNVLSEAAYMTNDIEKFSKVDSVIIYNVKAYELDEKFQPELDKLREKNSERVKQMQMNSVKGYFNHK